jgi:hypothetical protein
MARTDWIPGTREARYHLATRIWNYLYLSDYRNRIGLGADSPLGQWLDKACTPAFNAYSSATVAWLDEANRTILVTATFIMAEKAFLPLLREVYTLLKADPLVTDSDLEAMGLPKRSGNGITLHPAPTSFVESWVVLVGPGVLEIVYRNQGSLKKAKPRGIHGAEMAWGFLDAHPVDVSELHNSLLSTKTPITLRFEGHDRGKILYFSLRWENTTGQKGPWNDIQSTVIP